jgi:DNA-directed RNA polymerase I, II, and III subunit RPABC1
MEEPDWSTLYKVKLNQIKMMKDRGYSIPKKEANLLNYSLDEFIDFFYEKMEDYSLTQLLSIVYTKPDSVLIWYAPPYGKDVSIEEAREFITQLGEQEKSETQSLLHGILITDKNLGSSAASFINNTKLYDIEHFTYPDLRINVTQHFLVPFHKKMSSEESARFLKDNKLKPSQLPIIWVKDPQSRYYHFRVGDIIRIYRKSLIDPLSSKTVGYRVVVQDQ